VATVLVFGLAPALRAATANLTARATTLARSHGRFLDAIVVAELAVSVLLLTAAGLTLRSVYTLFHDVGFHADRVLIFRTPGVPADRRLRFYEDVIANVRALPGIREVSAVYSLPGGGASGRTQIFAEGVVEPTQAPVNPISGGYFGAM